MNKTILGMPAWPLVLLAALGAAHCSSDQLSSREMAEALAEEFTDGIEFEDQSVRSGAPDQTVALAPRITFLMAPHVISPPDPTLIERADYGEWFDVVLSADTDLTGLVVGGVAFVMQANKTDVATSYKLIQPATPNITGTQISFRARVNTFAGAPGNAFTVNLALLLSDGSITAWHPWNLVLYPMGGEATRVPSCQCEGAAITLVDSAACNETGFGPEIIGELTTQPCVLWHSMVGLQSQDAVLYPDGTRFWPYWMPAEADRAACIAEITCQEGVVD
ncbi:MAG TPA: hypothetical protein PK668_01510 [Myxococcota bacterium]|nr:hypothetical protein [Myxococcota bacterium]HRY96780.1 hypothetical protein [Myxococcota bacterium]